MDNDAIKFKAILAQVQSAVQIEPTGNSRLKLDISALYLNQVLNLVEQSKDKVLNVSISIEEEPQLFNGDGSVKDPIQ